ncbi:STAS domain-containing protein [Streptomyces sp. NPDC003635]
MTTLPPALELTTIDTQDTVRIEITGDLDHDTADLLLDEVTAQLTERPGLKDLHLHCAAVGVVDSMGLSALLMIGRRAAAAGARLHLDDRPAKLTRLLNITGTLDYFTAATPTGVSTSHQNTAPPVTMAAQAQTARSSGPDATA